MAHTKEEKDEERGKGREGAGHTLLSPCNIPRLLRLLRYTPLEHQYQSGIHRIEAQPKLDHNPSYECPQNNGLYHPPNSLEENASASDAHERIPGTAIEQP